jgi:hypothetical protein
LRTMSHSHSTACACARTNTCMKRTGETDKGHGGQG